MNASHVTSATLVSLLTFGLACSAIRQRDVTPRIDDVRPDSVMVPAGAVVEIVVRGHGFAPGAPGRNTVRFGEQTITSVPATENGTELRFVIPDRVPSGGEAAPLPLESGPYSVSIRTEHGESNARIVRVYR